MNAYLALEAHFGRIGRIGDALAILQWDMATMMPTGAAESRGEQMATLRVIAHEMTADPRVADWCCAAETRGEVNDWQRANLREIRRLHARAIALPGELVSEMSKAGAACEVHWREARAKNDFKSLAPLLERVVDLTREKAERLGTALSLTPYNALLDEYEPGASAERIDELFADLSSFLPPLIDKVIERQRQRGPILKPTGPFAVKTQRELGQTVMTAMGFEFDRGRLDVSHHPFCGGTPDDVRITTRYTEDDFTKSLMGVIHETGHALYERGLPSAWRYQPVGVARGMGMHESQSLLMEMQACRSREFMEFLVPAVRSAFQTEDAALSVDNLYRLSTRVERGLIRVDADEVTYPAHVVLRYRLERALIAGNLAVRDLPSAFRAEMRSLVGVEPESDRDGCMQDIHWMDGAFGYFPTYTLGAMIAAQLFDAAVKTESGLLSAISRGDFTPLLGWLRRHVHHWGSYLSADELLQKATGHPLDTAFFRRHLEKRYLGE